MAVETWIAFVCASLVMGLVPGPGVMSIVGYAIGSGRKTALASVAGMAVGNTVAMSLSLAGVGTILAASALAFTTLKWIGALYLIGLGVVTIARAEQNARCDESRTGEVISPRVAFASNVATGILHPKTIVFFVAFVPQFMSDQAAYLPQAVLLVLTFALTVGCTDTAYALAAARASRVLRGKTMRRWSQRAGGGVMIAAGMATAAARR
jgi:threonine/homoserine/homoserine lactone efflux protein